MSGERGHSSDVGPRGGGGGGRGGRGRRGGGWGQNGFEAWGGYMEAKIAKLEDQFSADVRREEEDGEEGIFRGVAIFVNGYTDPSADELKRTMMMNGGTFHHYFSSKKTTHIIATNLPDAKVKMLKGDEPICSPKWIVDCLAEGRLLDFRKYLLYSTQSKTQPKINFLPAKSPTKDAKKSAAAAASGSAASLDSNDSRFLGEFYSNSRLHHISSMGANFKRHINDLREKSDGTLPMREKLKEISSSGGGGGSTFVPYKKKIMHIDMDCFFVSVGLRKRPDLIGKPVAVAHAAKGASSSSATVSSLEERTESFSSMSELASCSYEARAKGVKNGMFLGPALKLCPELQTMPYNFNEYQEVAFALYNCCSQFTLNIQAVSCDELLVDITDVLNEVGLDAVAFAEHLRSEIFSLTGCRASVGLGSSILLARLATKRAKPDGCFNLLDEHAETFMRTMDVNELPGVGRKTASRLREMRIQTCEHMQALSLQELKAEFGARTGESFHRFCRGIDDRVMDLCHERKSVSAEVNYGIRFKSAEDCANFLDQLSGEVQSRMERIGVRGRCVTLKLMVRAEDAPRETAKFLGHGICDQVSRSSSLSFGTDDVGVIRREVRMLMRQLGVDHAELRGVGIQVSKLEGGAAGGRAAAAFATGGGASGSKSILSFMRKEEKTTVAAAGAAASVVRPDEGDRVTDDISFSQLDQDVVASLPEDIRKEIEETYGRRRPHGIISKQAVAAAPAAATASTSSSSSSLLDVTFSQVDPDYLAALPQAIADELRQEMDAAKRTSALVQVLQTRTAFDKMMTHTSKSPAGSPLKRPRRGRPPKNSPRFLKNKVSGSPAVARASGMTSNTNKAVSRALFEEDAKCEMDSEKVSSEKDFEKEAAAATLEGVSELDDVRSMLKQWISSSSCPTDDDVETVSKYFQDLVREKGLDRLAILIRLLCRRTKSQSDGWREAYTKVVNNVQIVMVQNYGYRLFTNF